MPRKVERHTERRARLERTEDRDNRLKSWLGTEIEAALGSRRRLENVWREARRQYDGVPKRPVRTSPIPNAPNIEITVGAIATDQVVSAATDALFTASPLLIARHNNERWVNHAKAAQTFVNWMTANEVRLRHAVDQAFIDDAQLGTAAYYTPWVREVRKTDIRRTINEHPEIIPIAPENLIIPALSTADIQDARWVGLRFTYTKTEVEDRAAANPRWDISKTMPVATIEWQRDHREQLGHVRNVAHIREHFEFIDVYAYFDYDEDGECEDLLITWDRSSGAIVALGYNPYDIRPINKMVYQARAHLPYGIGVMEMIQPYQEEATELHNYKILNAMLSNAAMYVATTASGISETMEVWPSKVVIVDDINSFKPFPMAPPFPQMALFEQSAMTLAESRVGLRGELSMLAKGGSRTPATTALSLLQQTNRRFTTAFDQARLATAGAVRQCLWRYSERVKVNDENVREHFHDVLNDNDAELLWELLEQDNFERSVSVEFTAASATVSREADRQNALLLMQTMDQTHQRIAELVSLASQEGVPEELRQGAIKMIRAKNEMFERLLRTFDMVRDPSTFVADITPELEAASQQREQEEQIMAQLQQVAGANGGLLPVPAGVPPIEEPPPGGP
jgi:hypothetical protein